MLVGLAVLLLSSTVTGLPQRDGGAKPGTWRPDGTLVYATFGDDNRPQCAALNVTWPVAATTGLPADAFVGVSGTHFTLGECDPFIFAGWNQWEVLELASDAPAPFRWTPKCGREHIVSVLNRAAEDGLTVMRAWAHTITEGHAMSPAPGEYDERVLEGMDFVMDEARKRGIKLIWAFADNWYPVGGMDEYVERSPTAREHQDFFTDDGAKALFKSHVRTLLNRKNSINGVVYKDDPTVMAWNLLNEGRCQGCKSEPLQSWVEEMCAFVKSVDDNHLVGLGLEGFYGPGSGNEGRNPAEWATDEGQDFIENHLPKCVDYVGIHVWPDNWEKLDDPAFLETYIKQHIADTEEIIKKPFLLEEFGKIVEDSTFHSVRNEFFDTAFAVAEANAKSGGPLRGTLFWHWYDEGVGPGKYGVHVSDTTWDKITDHAAVMNGLRGSAKPVC